MIDQRCAEMGLPCVSVLEPVLTVFQSYLGTPAGRRVGAQHVLDAEYFRRIDALNFTMEHDDGQLPDDIDEADIVLIGISRTSKTPTSIYLANRGIKTANIPIVLGVPIPGSLTEAKRPLIVGLIATAERISQVRQNRVLGTVDELRFADLCRPRDDRRGTELRPSDLHAPRLADDRCDAAVDRRDGGRHRCAARQGALGADNARCRMTERSSLLRAARFARACSPMPGSPSPRSSRTSTSAPPRRRSRAAAQRPRMWRWCWPPPRQPRSANAIPAALVIGSDQTLSLGDEIFHKPVDMEAARRHLLALSGRTHQLNSAVALVRNGETLWSHVAVARLTMRKLEPAFIGRYLARVGDKALSSVGAYQIEGEGIQLFEKIEGDYFTIVGLPLLPAAGCTAGTGCDRWLRIRSKPSSAAIRSPIRARR